MIHHCICHFPIHSPEDVLLYIDLRPGQAVRIGNAPV